MPRHRFWFAALMGAGFLLNSATTVARADDTATLRAHLVAWYTRNAPEAGTIERYVHAQRADGSWPDVDYANTDRGGWRTFEHLGRTLEMARAYRAAGHPMEGQSALGMAIVAALEHWVEKDYVNSNWWYPQIGVPDALAPTLVLMGEAVPRDLRDKAIEQVLGRSKMGMTGQNKVWLAGIALMKGLLAEDADLLAEARRQIFEELRLTTEEGIQPDFSFHQHGPQLQWGNYGAAFAGSMLKWAGIFHGTDYALTPEQVDLLSRYLLEGTATILWNGRMDVSGCGRQIFRGSQAGKGRSALRQLEMMAAIDPARANLYREAIACNQPGRDNTFIGHKHFWRSDISVHRRPDWYASVKMCSTRVIGAETCNSENMLGLHLADGVTYFLRTGREYEDLFPVWDWRRLPGTTCRQSQTPLVPSTNQCRGRSDFAGGVAVGKYGLAAMEYLRDDLTARKAWFFLEDAVVCLGSGIQCDGGESVLTSVNQCAANGPVTVTVDGKTSQLSKRDQAGGAIEWVHHDEIGYLFLAPAQVAANVQTQQGTWYQVHHRESKRSVERDVFNLWIGHGTAPDEAQYAYAVFPNVSVETMPTLSQTLSLVIVEQSKDVLAVQSGDGKRLLAAFFEPGQITWSGGRTLSVDQACLIVVDETMPFPSLYVCDPTQKQKVLHVRLSGRFRGQGTTYDANAGQTEVRIPLPEGGASGQTVVVNPL